MSFDQHGNAAVIEALEQMLERARNGRMGYLVALGLEDDRAIPFFGGSVPMMPVARRTLDRLAAAMDGALVNRTLPPRDPAVPANRVCYNMATAPMSFDFLPWLIDAEMTRIREGAPAPLRVAFWFGRDGQVGRSVPSRIQMLARVARPMLALVGAVEDDTAIDGRFKEMFTSRDIVAAAKAGECPPTLRVPVAADWAMHEWLGGSRPVTITLREATHWPHRNSNLADWLRVASHLRDRGERVIFVRDTAQADTLIPDWQTCPGASRNLHTRVALYAAAKANLFVSNGPASLAWFMDCPWLTFLELQPDGHPYRPDTPSFWREHNWEPGEQLPWSRPDQRIIWAPPELDTIIDAWERWIVPAMERQVA